jgi:hypothetical protein
LCQSKGRRLGRRKAYSKTLTMIPKEKVKAMNPLRGRGENPCIVREASAWVGAEQIISKGKYGLLSANV